MGLLVHLHSSLKYAMNAVKTKGKTERKGKEETNVGDDEGRCKVVSGPNDLRFTLHVLRGSSATLYAFLVRCLRPVCAFILLACMRREAMP